MPAYFWVHEMRWKWAEIETFKLSEMSAPVTWHRLFTFFPRWMNNARISSSLNIKRFFNLSFFQYCDEMSQDFSLQVFFNFLRFYQLSPSHWPTCLPDWFGNGDEKKNFLSDMRISLLTSKDLKNFFWTFVSEAINVGIAVGANGQNWNWGCH